VNSAGAPIAVADIPRKIAESTGRLPPTPMLHTAAREHNVIEFDEAPPDRANTPVMKSVRLKDNLMVSGFMRRKFRRGAGIIPASPDI